MSTNRTPGPWEAWPPLYDMDHFTVLACYFADGAKRLAPVVVAECEGEDMEDNALLIAAAPDLLEAAENMSRAFYRLRASDLTPAARVALHGLRRAIAKATATEPVLPELDPGTQATS